MVIFFYTRFVIAAGAVLYSGCSVIAGAVLYADCSVAAGVNTHVKGFADACYKDEEGVAEGVIYYKDKEGEQRHEEVIASLIKVKLRQL
jgi:hypothetical protein